MMNLFLIKQQSKKTYGGSGDTARPTVHQAGATEETKNLELYSYKTRF